MTFIHFIIMAFPIFNLKISLFLSRLQIRRSQPKTASGGLLEMLKDGGCGGESDLYYVFSFFAQRFN